MTDGAIVWADQIEVRAGAVAKKVLDRLESMLRKQIDGHDRKNLHAAIAEEVVSAMYRLGTFVCAGAAESMGVHIKNFACAGQSADDTKITLTPLPSDNFLQLLAANAGKNAVLAFVNETAYTQARDELVKEIHREQTDWVHQAEKARLTEGPAPAAPMTDDLLLAKLVELSVPILPQAVSAWSERERVVAWDWAVAYEKARAAGADCPIARPHWIPIPEPTNRQEQPTDAEQSNNDSAAPAEDTGLSGESGESGCGGPVDPVATGAGEGSGESAPGFGESNGPGGSEDGADAAEGAGGEPAARVGRRSRRARS